MQATDQLLRLSLQDVRAAYKEEKYTGECCATKVRQLWLPSRQMQYISSINLVLGSHRVLIDLSLNQDRRVSEQT